MSGSAAAEGGRGRRPSVGCGVDRQSHRGEQEPRAGKTPGAAAETARGTRPSHEGVRRDNEDAPEQPGGRPGHDRPDWREKGLSGGRHIGGGVGTLTRVRPPPVRSSRWFPPLRALIEGPQQETIGAVRSHSAVVQWSAREREATRLLRD